MTERETLETGIAAFAMSAMFLIGKRVRITRDQHTVLSFGGGMSIAYVFVQVMPELQEARNALVDSIGMSLRFQGMAIYMVALLGFLLLYGLENLRERLDAEAGKGKGEVRMSVTLHVAGFAAYVPLVSYLMVHNLHGTSEQAIGLYALAMCAHFLALDHSLRSEHGDPYLRVGRRVLAAMVLLGWVVGLLVDLPRYVLAFMFAFIAGAIIVNSAIMELPSGRGGRFVPFFIGGLGYGTVLWALGGM